MTSVVVRADGSEVLGIGNVTRSMAIAEAFAMEGARITYAARNLDPRVRNLVDSMGWEFVPLAPRMSIDEDIAATARVIAQREATVCVVDLGNPEATSDLAAYSTYLRATAAQSLLVVADDLTRAVFPAGLIVNPNTEVTEADYDTTFGPTFLFGPSYAILRAAYRHAARARAPIGAHEPKTVAVSLGGGVVASQLLEQVLEGIRAGLGNRVHIELVTGFGSARDLEERGALRGFARVTTHANLPSLRDVLLRADIAVVSGGVTKYEAAATGTPMVIVPSIDHQESWGSAFARTGAAVYAGALDAIDARTVAVALATLRDPDVRRRQSEVGQALVDGFGPQRVARLARDLLDRARR